MLAVMLEVHLSAVRVDLQSKTPVVLLQEANGARALPIFIGAPEATAIAFALQHVEVPRPMTHDLMKDLVEALGATVMRVVITEVRDTTYYAEIQLDLAGREVDLSARPSDAIALAARTNSPLFVEDALMEDAGVVLEDDEEIEDGEESPEELVDQFRDFLDEVKPEDFKG
jgi:bifunctional DNase/RNase